MPDALHAPRKKIVSQINTAPPAALSGASRLVRRHLTALSLLAIFSMAGLVAGLVFLRAPQGDSPVIVQAAAQRTLSQRLVLGALAIQASQSPAQRVVWETDLRDTAALWRQGAQALPRTNDKVGAELDAAAPAQNAMLTAAEGLLGALPPDASHAKVDVSSYLTPLFLNQKPYENSMKSAVTEYEQAAQGHLNSLRELMLGLEAATLVALAGLALPLLRPNQGSIGRTVTDLDLLEEKKGELDTALGEADRQIAQMRLTLENLETIDTLTGLKNHRAFQEQLDSEMGRALRHGHPLSLLLLDVDRFKSYNDSYSHVEGDQALKLLADLLRETLRISDLPARYGGKEFAIIMPDTDMMGAVVLGERLRQAVASADGLQRPLTVSIGIATLTPNVFSAAGLIAQADRALCHAKGDGRNRVSHAHRIPAPLEDEAPVYARAA